MMTVGKGVTTVLRRSLIVALLAGSAVAVHAEVSAVVDPAPPGSRGSIYLGIILDGPDPILGVWARHGVFSSRANTRHTRGSIYLGAVVDGPDPINGIWLRVGAFSSRVVLNESGSQRGDGPPTVLGNPAGPCAVAWAQHKPGGFDVVMSRFVDGAWQSEHTFADTAVDERFDSLAGHTRGSTNLATIVDSPDSILGVWIRIGAFSSRVVLNESGAQRGVLGDPGGTCAVAWAQHNPGGFDVVMSRFEDGAWLPEETLANAAVDELDPVFVSLPDGSVRLFYWEVGPSPRILARTASPDLSAWSAPEVVSEPGVRSARPAAVIHDGALWIVYEVLQAASDTSPRQIVTAHEVDGQWVRDVLAVSSADAALYPEIHSRSGHLWIDWIDAPGQVLWLQREANGDWTTIGTVPYATELERDYFTRGSVRALAVE